MDTPKPPAASPEDIANLRRHLEGVLAIADGVFSQPIQLDATNQLAFMAVNFAAKQSEHARSILILNDQMDAILIARSMFEGLSQLLWAAQSPEERPLRWRASAFVRDWRTMREHEKPGVPITAEQRAYIETGLAEYGPALLTAKAKKAQEKGQPLPDDPFLWHWYAEKEKEIFEAVGGQLAYDHLYGPFSEWHHWRIGGFGFLLKFDEQAGRFQMTPRNPQFTASALSSAFQCLWQTLQVLEQVVPGTISADLEKLRDDFVAECGIAAISGAVSGKS